MKIQSVQDTGLWEAWIEFDEFDPSNFGTLYIIGEISIGKQKARFIKLPQKSKNKTLHLMMPVQLSNSQYLVKEVLYSEAIESIDKYNAVKIYAGQELIVSFDEIEIMI